MAPNPQMQTFEMFGKQIRYDPSKPYGIFNDGDYGRFPGKNFPDLAKMVGKEKFRGFLDSQTVMLKELLEKEKGLESLVQKGVHLNPTQNKILNEREALENSIELFRYIAMELGS